MSTMLARTSPLRSKKRTRNENPDAPPRKRKTGEEAKKKMRILDTQRISWNLDAGDGLDACLSKRRNQLRTLRSYIPALQSLETMLLSRRNSLRKPWQRVERKAIERRIKRVQARISELEERKDEREFESSIQSFVIAYAEQREKEQLAGSRNHRLHPNLPVVQRRKPGTAIGGVPELALPFAPPRGTPLPATATGYSRQQSLVGLVASTASSVAVSSSASSSAHNNANNDAEDEDVIASSAAVHSDVEETQTKQIVQEMLVRLKAQAPAVRVQDTDHCRLCNVPLLKSTLEPIMICPVCRSSKTYLDSTAAATAFGEDVEYNKFAYRRSNHFNEFLNLFQAKERTIVSPEDVKTIAKALAAKGFTKNSDVTLTAVHSVVRELKLKNCYEHEAQITSRLSGMPPPRMTKEQLITCKILFDAIQGPFDRHRHGRTNFLNYSYCMYKFCQMMGYIEFLPCFPLLRGEDKLFKMDQIFQNLCAELGWTCPPTV